MNESVDIMTALEQAETGLMNIEKLAASFYKELKAERIPEPLRRDLTIKVVEKMLGQIK